MGNAKLSEALTIDMWISASGKEYIHEERLIHDPYQKRHFL